MSSTLERQITHSEDFFPLQELPLWLQAQKIYPKIYWQGRGDARAFGALGQLVTFSHIPQVSTEIAPFRLFGGHSFSKAKQDAIWDPFPKCQFWLPRFEVCQRKESATLQSRWIEEEPPSLHSAHLLVKEKRELLGRVDTPHFSLWQKGVEEALRKIENRQIEKVILARKTTLTFNRAVNPWEILLELQKKKENASLFAFQMDADHTFLGASPEKLYTREKGTLQTEALAGTRRRGKDAQEDLYLEDQLLHDPKEKREFACVKRSIHTTLSPLCSSIKWEERDHVLKTSTVQHLYNRMQASLLPEVSDAILLSALHPTPAIGGFPRDKALEFLLAQEEFDRGWYAAPLGWISAEESDFAVGIRSALIEKNKVHLFAGTGIVAGSDPQKEWEELEQKISRFLQVLL